ATAARDDRTRDRVDRVSGRRPAPRPPHRRDSMPAWRRSHKRGRDQRASDGQRSGWAELVARRAFVVARPEDEVPDRHRRGGTFTDLVLAAGARLWLDKHPTTPTDQSEGVLAGLARLARH